MTNLNQLVQTTTGALLIVLGTAQIGQAITTFGDPADYTVPSGGKYDGVGIIKLGDEPDSNGVVPFCTGSLLTGGSYFVTAAHCLTDDSGKLVFGTQKPRIKLPNIPTGTFTTSVSQYFINPEWNGNFMTGGDLAVIKLSEPAPAEIKGYDIYRQNDEVGQNFELVGYGITGTGETGGVRFDGKERFGQNRIDLLTTDIGIDLEALIIDFDNGKPENDFLGIVAGINDTGLGAREVFPYVRDSGAPGFINKQIAGIVSFGIGCGQRQILGVCATDVDQSDNGSFGEFAGYTRVSNYASFIDDVVAERITPTESSTIPESTSVLSLVAFGLGLGIFVRGKQQQ